MVVVYVVASVVKTAVGVCMVVVYVVASVVAALRMSPRSGHFSYVRTHLFEVAPVYVCRLGRATFRGPLFVRTHATLA